MVSAVSDQATIAAALWIASGAACVIAIALTLLLRRLYLVLRTIWTLYVMTATVTVVLFLFAYIAALAMFFTVGSTLLNSEACFASPREIGSPVSFSWIHPGMVHHALPLITMITTWLIVSRMRRSGATAG